MVRAKDGKTKGAKSSEGKKSGSDGSTRSGGGGWQKDIKATREGTTKENKSLREKTSYGYKTDSDKFVALPSGGQKGKWVELKDRKTGTRVIAPVGDVGPFNGGGTKKEPRKFDDPYWKTGQRPQTETGADKRGRKTNKAGIDVSQGLWKAMGKGKKGSAKVDWRFTNPPKDKEPRVYRSAPKETRKDTHSSSPKVDRSRQGAGRKGGKNK
jgi:hypothetical protein